MIGRLRALVTLLVAAIVTSCSSDGGDAKPSADFVAGVLRPETGFDAGNHVRIDPMIESEVAVRTRARRLGLPVEQVQPKAFGLVVTMLYPDVEIGVAFLRQQKIYFLDGFDGRIFIDRKYIYGEGFLAPNILRTSERGWSEQYAVSQASVTLLEELANSVMRGERHEAAYEAIASFGPLSLAGAPEAGRYEREVSWLAGSQRIDSAYFFVGSAPKVGNRLSARFISRP